MYKIDAQCDGNLLLFVSNIHFQVLDHYFLRHSYIFFRLFDRKMENKMFFSSDLISCYSLSCKIARNNYNIKRMGKAFMYFFKFIFYNWKLDDSASGKLTEGIA